MQTNKHTNILPLVLIFLLVTILAGGCYWYCKQSAYVKNQELIAEQEKAKESSASKEIKKVEEVKKEDTEAEIKAALAELFSIKYNRTVEDANITISKREGDYIVGGVKFAGEIAGGYLLGAKVNGEWKIIFDGNGTIPCESVELVSFPSDLVTECWDTVNNVLVDRTAN
jgi:hypothetical protein